MRLFYLFEGGGGKGMGQTIASAYVQRRCKKVYLIVNMIYDIRCINFFTVFDRDNLLL